MLDARKNFRREKKFQTREKISDARTNVRREKKFQTREKISDARKNVRREKKFQTREKISDARKNFRREKKCYGLIPRALFLGEMRIFRLFLLNFDYSNKLFLLDCSQFKRNRRNISHFAEKKRPWNQAFRREKKFQTREKISDARKKTVTRL